MLGEKKKACITKVLPTAITRKKKVTNIISMVKTITRETKKEGQRKAKRCTTYRNEKKKGES